MGGTPKRGVRHVGIPSSRTSLASSATGNKHRALQLPQHGNLHTWQPLVAPAVALQFSRLSEFVQSNQPQGTQQQQHAPDSLLPCSVAFSSLPRLSREGSPPSNWLLCSR